MKEYPIYRRDGSLYATYTDNGGEFIDVKFSMNGVDTRDIDTYSMKIDKPSFKNSVQFLDKSGFTIHTPEVDDYFASEQYLASKDKYNLGLLNNVDGTLEVQKIFDDLGNISITYRDLIDEGWEVGYDRTAKMPKYLYNHLDNGEVEYIDVDLTNPENITIRTIGNTEFQDQIKNKQISVDTGDVINSSGGKYLPLTTMYKMVVPEATDTQLLDFFEEHVDFPTDIDYKATIKRDNPNAKSSNEINQEKKKNPTNPDVISQEKAEQDRINKELAVSKIKEEEAKKIAEINAEAESQKQQLKSNNNDLVVNDELGEKKTEDEYAKAIVTPDDTIKSVKEAQQRAAELDINKTAELKKIEVKTDTENKISSLSNDNTGKTAEEKELDRKNYTGEVKLNGEVIHPGTITNSDGQNLGRVAYYPRTGKYDIISTLPNGEISIDSYENIDDFIKANPDVNVLNNAGDIIKSGERVLNNTAQKTVSINGKEVVPTGAKLSETPLYNNKENIAPDNNNVENKVNNNAENNNIEKLSLIDDKNDQTPDELGTIINRIKNSNPLTLNPNQNILSKFNPNQNTLSKFNPNNLTYSNMEKNPDSNTLSKEEFNDLMEAKITADLASGEISKTEAESKLEEQLISESDILEVETDDVDNPGSKKFVPREEYNGYKGSLNEKNIDPYMGKYNYKDLNIYGNRFQHNANMIPVAFNSAKALWDKAEVQSAFNNPHDFAYLQGLRNNMEQLNTNDNRGAFAGMMQYLSGNAKGAGARLSNAQAAYSNYANQLDQEAARVQAANVGHMNNYLQALKTTTDARTDERRRVDDENRLHRATQEEFVRDTIKGYESALRQKGIGMNKEWQAYISKAAANAANPNYTFHFDPLTGEVKASFEGGRKKGEVHDVNRENGITSGKDINDREKTYHKITGAVSNDYLRNALSLRINNEPLKPFAGLFGKNALPGQVNIGQLNKERQAQFNWEQGLRDYIHKKDEESKNEQPAKEVVETPPAETEEENNTIENAEEKAKKLGGYVVRKKGDSKFQIPNAKKPNPFEQFNKKSNYF